jgi:ubiquinone/menaquinone biosynthesis C-methylase UbiE
LRLGYPAELLDRVPTLALNVFTGIGAPLLDADLVTGERVLDLGCGAGMDSFLAAPEVGLSGHVYGVDLAPGMVACARRAVTDAGLQNVTILEGVAERLPLPDQSVDVALVNGLFNLAPEKPAVARELTRVVRPGGRLVGAEIVITDERPPGDPDEEA